MNPEPFRLGVNLPWLQYGCDFGANAWQPDGGVAVDGRRTRLRQSFARISDRGFALVRWFVLCDGRAGLRVDEGGTVLGLDDAFWRDLEAGVEEAGRAGIALVPVLFDYPLCRRAKVTAGVRCGGRHRWLASKPHRAALVDRVVRPILRRCAGETTIAAWDILNEPEWITWLAGAILPFTSVSRAVMRQFIGEVADAVHAETRQQVTVGLASWRGLELVSGLGLDIYQAHWYDRRERRAPLARAIAGTLDGPLWLGEFPTADSRRTPDEIIATARQAGYACALAWSAEAVDRHSDLGRLGVGS